MTTQTETAVGRGVIAISRGFTRELFPELLELDDCTLQGELKTSGVFERIHKTLLLPDSYSIIGIFYATLMSWHYSPQALDWLILVESPDIAPAGEDEWFPRVTPVYQRHADGTNSLLRIEIEPIQ